MESVICPVSLLKPEADSPTEPVFTKHLLFYSPWIFFFFCPYFDFSTMLHEGVLIEPFAAASSFVLTQLSPSPLLSSLVPPERAPGTV